MVRWESLEIAANPWLRFVGLLVDSWTGGPCFDTFRCQFYQGVSTDTQISLVSAQSHVGLYYNVNWKKFAPIKLMQGNVLDQIRAHVLIISLIQLGLWRFLSWWNFIRAPLTNYSSRRTFIQRGPSFWGPQEKPRSAAAPLHPPSCAFTSGLNTTWWNSSPPPTPMAAAIL